MGVSSYDGVSGPRPRVSTLYGTPPPKPEAASDAGGSKQFKLEKSKLEAREVSYNTVERALAPFYGPLNAVSQLADVERCLDGWFLWRW